MKRRLVLALSIGLIWFFGFLIAIEWALGARQYDLFGGLVLLFMVSGFLILILGSVVRNRRRTSQTVPNPTKVNTLISPTQSYQNLVASLKSHNITYVIS